MLGLSKEEQLFLNYIEKIIKKYLSKYSTFDHKFSALTNFVFPVIKAVEKLEIINLTDEFYENVLFNISCRYRFSKELSNCIFWVLFANINSNIDLEINFNRIGNNCKRWYYKNAIPNFQLSIAGDPWDENITLLNSNIVSNSINELKLRTNGVCRNIKEFNEEYLPPTFFADPPEYYCFTTFDVPVFYDKNLNFFSTFKEAKELNPNFLEEEVKNEELRLYIMARKEL